MFSQMGSKRDDPSFVRKGNTKSWNDQKSIDFYALLTEKVTVLNPCKKQCFCCKNFALLLQELCFVVGRTLLCRWKRYICT